MSNETNKMGGGGGGRLEYLKQRIKQGDWPTIPIFAMINDKDLLWYFTIVDATEVS